MAETKKLKIGEDPLPPNTITIDGVEIKQIKDTTGEILWGKYSITNSNEVYEFMKEYCTDFNLKFSNSTEDSVVVNIDANRDYILNQPNIGYHGENMKCTYDVIFPFCTGADSNYRWIINYDSEAENFVSGDLEIKTFKENPNQVWPKIGVDVRNGVLNQTVYTNLSTPTINRISSPYAKASLGKINFGQKVYYGDTLELTWTHSQTGKVPLSGKTYKLELRGDGVNTSGEVVEDTSYKNNYLFYNNRVVSLNPGTFDYPLYIYTPVSWATNSSNGNYILNGLIMHHPLIRGDKIPIWSCCSNDTFSISGAGINEATSYSFNTDDHRKYNLYDTSATLYPGDIISRSNGNPFKNENGHSLMSTTFSLTHTPTNASNKVMPKPTHCYLVYIYDGKAYKIDLLNNTTSLVNFTFACDTSTSYLRADATGKDLRLIFPKATITAPINVSGEYEVTATVKIYNESGTLVRTEPYILNGFFVKPTSPVTILTGSMFLLDDGKTVTKNYSGDISVEYKIYDINRNLMHTGSMAWQESNITIVS